MEMMPQESVTMKACILRVCCCDLLVCDLCTSQQVLVHTPDACCFRAGERVCITNSLPPQISATKVERLCGC